MPRYWDTFPMLFQYLGTYLNFATQGGKFLYPWSKFQHTVLAMDLFETIDQKGPK